MRHRIITFLLVIGAVLMLGCTLIPDETKVYDKFERIQQKYYVTDNYSSNLSTMNDYINELVQLKAQANGPAGKVIETEIYSAQTFYYLQKTLVESTSIDYQSIQCSSQPVKGTLSALSMSKSNLEKANSFYSSLSEKEKSKLRSNQEEILKGYLEQITQIDSFFKSEC